MARRWKFEQTQIVPKSRSEVFAFFADASNLERLTPGFLRCRGRIGGKLKMAEELAGAGASPHG